MSFSSRSIPKTLFFWLAIVFMGVTLWKLVSSDRQPAETIAYSDFARQVEDKQVREAHIYLEPNSVSVVAVLRSGSRRVEATVSYGDLQDLKTHLIDGGASVEYANTKQSDWVLILLNAAPLILLVGFCLFLMRRMSGGVWRGRSLQASASRTGIGYDLHRLEAGRKLIVGGVALEFDKGPAGHSDGDVVAHALCDALLGAAGLGDIGTHFPDTDPKWKGADSMIFLQHARKLLDEKKFAIEHVDAVVILERPKLGPHFPKMREALGRALGVEAAKIHLKAKTNEGVDAVGRGEAIAAYVVATLAAR
jgi:2-C-methyl-D-erythritol 2,4-cyclodiphosphate synthase